MITRLFANAYLGVWLLDDSRRTLRNLSLVAQEETIDGAFSVPLESDPISNQVITSAETKVLSPAGPHAVTTSSPFFPVDGHGSSAIMLPLLSRDAVIGLMCIRAALSDKVFTPTDVALAEAITGPLANTIENTKLFTKAQIAEVEDERRRLLHDLLDSVYQALFAADLTADVLPKLWETDPDQGRQALGDMKRFTHGALAEIRVLMVELRSPKR
jgi:GAF domain-containing protein